jgi:hypothetical protein
MVAVASFFRFLAYPLHHKEVNPLGLAFGLPPSLWALDYFSSFTLGSLAPTTGYF